MSATTQQFFFDRAEVVAIAHARGLKHITEKSVITAAYEGNKPLKRTKVNGRVYYAQPHIDAWLSGVVVQD